MQSFPTIATGSSLLATMVFIHSQHHALQESANSDVAACRRTPYRRGAAYPREVSRARDFTRSHGLQTSILFLIPLIQFTCLPDCPLLTLGKDRNRRLLSSPRERQYPLKTALTQSFPTIATSSSLPATMAFIQSQHHALQESANSDVAACRRTPYRRGAAYPREVSRTRDFTRSHGLQTSILFLIPFIQFTCLPDCPLLTLGKDRNRRLLSQPRERLSSLKDSTNAVFFLHRHIQWAVSMATNIPPHS